MAYMGRKRSSSHNISPFFPDTSAATVSLSSSKLHLGFLGPKLREEESNLNKVKLL